MLHEHTSRQVYAKDASLPSQANKPVLKLYLKQFRGCTFGGGDSSILFLSFNNAQELFISILLFTKQMSLFYTFMGVLWKSQSNLLRDIIIDCIRNIFN